MKEGVKVSMMFMLVVGVWYGVGYMHGYNDRQSIAYDEGRERGLKEAIDNTSDA